MVPLHSVWVVGRQQRAVVPALRHLLNQRALEGLRAAPTYSGCDTPPPLPLSYPRLGSTVNDCPNGYLAVGSLSDNNDVTGTALGQSTQPTIEDCQASDPITRRCPLALIHYRTSDRVSTTAHLPERHHVSLETHSTAVSDALTSTCVRGRTRRYTPLRSLAGQVRGQQALRGVHVRRVVLRSQPRQ